MQFCVDGFAGQEQQCGLSRLTRDDVAFRNVLHMLAQIVREGTLSGDTGGLFLCLTQSLVALQWKLGVDRDGAGRVGQFYEAVRAPAARQGRLKVVGRGRQGGLYQVLQLHFPEGAARLLVRQDVLQSDHLRGKLRNVLLRPVDHSQSFAQIGHGRRLALRLRVQSFADPLGEVAQSQVHRFGELPFLAAQCVGDLGLGSGLALGHGLEPLLQHRDVRRPLSRRAVVPAAPQHGQRQQQDQQQSEASEQKFEADGHDAVPMFAEERKSIACAFRVARLDGSWPTA